MMIDLTFRVELPETSFREMQSELADCANAVQFDRWLMASLRLPRADRLDYVAQGLLVGVTEFKTEETEQYKTP